MNKISTLISPESKIAIISHISPDGDSLGSIIGLGLSLKQMSENVDIFVNDKIPSRYSFLTKECIIKEYSKDDEMSFDMCFVLDCGDQKRLGYSEKILEQSKIIVNIDHHISNTYFGDINIVDTNASAACELIYNIIKNLDIKINKSIATAIYTGIATDTGNFSYDNTTVNTHKIVAELLSFDVNLSEISFYLYQNKSINSVKFLGYIIENLEIMHNGKIAIATITLSALELYKLPYTETEGYINYLRDIQGVEIAILLIEIESNKTKISLRSKNNMDVNSLAKLFGGGGHKKAAGAMIEEPIEIVKNKIINEASIFCG